MFDWHRSVAAYDRSVYSVFVQRVLQPTFTLSYFEMNNSRSEKERLHQ